ncbi:MAG: glycosyltransferase [Acidobacteria bacterium]|nr:MAG: glycosyltransferase [Acidobacteriota bacterium]
MQQRLKILFVTGDWILPLGNGAQQRALNISRLLGRIGDVSFAIIPRHTDDPEMVSLNKRGFDVRVVFHAAPEAPKGAFGRLGRRFRREFDAGCLETDIYSISACDRAALLNLVQGYDVVWVQDVKTANSCRIGRWTHSVLDTVDVPSNMCRSMARTRGNVPRRLLDYRHSWIWMRRERLFTERFDVVTVCSEDESRLFGAHPRVHVIPNGFNAQPVLRSFLSEAPRLGFIGTLGWRPNREGFEWFARDVWPNIKRELPRAQLRIIGKSTGDAGGMGPDIAGLGWLEDPGEEIATWSAMIVPIRFGAGTRVKMAEGFARKCPIVATTIGAFGYGVRDGEEFLHADDAQDFASACVRLARDPELGRAIADRAHQRFLREWSWDAQEDKIRAVIRECLARSGRPQEVARTSDCEVRGFSVDQDKSRRPQDRRSVLLR